MTDLNGLNSMLLTQDATQSQAHVGSAASAHRPNNGGEEGGDGGGRRIQRTQLRNLQPAGGTKNNSTFNVAEPLDGAGNKIGDMLGDAMEKAQKQVKRKKGATHKHLT